MQRQSLIPEPDVGLSCTDDLLGDQKSPGTEAIRDRHGDDGLADVDAVLHDEGEIVPLVARAALDQAAAVDPDADGKSCMLVAGRTDDIVVQAVLRDRIPDLVSAVANAFRGVGGGLQRAVEAGVQALGVAEPQLGERRLGVGHTEEVILMVGGRVTAGDGAVLEMDGRGRIVMIAPAARTRVVARAGADEEGKEGASCSTAAGWSAGGGGGGERGVKEGSGGPPGQAPPFQCVGTTGSDDRHVFPRSLPAGQLCPGPARGFCPPSPAQLTHGLIARPRFTMPVATMQMNAFAIDQNKALPRLPLSPPSNDPDSVSSATDQNLLPGAHPRPYSPTYLRDKTNEDANARNLVTPPAKEKRVLTSRKMMLLRSQPNRDARPRVQPGPGHQRDHPSISTLNDEPTLASSPTLADPRTRATDHDRNSHGSLPDEDMAGMPAFLAKYKTTPGEESEDGLSRNSREDEQDDDDDETVMETATVIEDSVEAQRLQQEKDERASAILSKRAEQILANAKRRLNVMEGNLRGARDLVAPLTAANLKRATSLGSAHGAPYPSRSLLMPAGYDADGAQPARGLHSQLSSPTIGRDYQGHARNFSANSVHDRSYRVSGRHSSLARSNRIPVKVDDAAVNHALRSSRSYDSFAHNSAIYHAISRDGTQPHRGSPDPALEPLREDDPLQMNTYDERYGYRKHASSLSRYSPSIPDDLRSQMSTLKGKISTLRERAREDSLRRQSLLSLKSASPFSNATADSPELYYTPSPGHDVHELDGNAVADPTGRGSPHLPLADRDSQSVTRSGNAFAQRAAAERQQKAASPSSGHPLVAEHGRPLRSTMSAQQLSLHQRTPSGSAIIQSAKQRFSHHQHQTSQGSSNSSGTVGFGRPRFSPHHRYQASKSSTNSGSSKDSAQSAVNQNFDNRETDDEGLFIHHDAHDQTPPTTVRMHGTDVTNEDNDSVYEDAEDVAEPAVVAHEDRDDAFDYEHFFLHSAMGTYSRARRDSSSSDDSVSSAQTARGPGAARYLVGEEDDDDDDDDDADLFPPSTPQTPERLREIERNIHQRTHSADSVDTVSTFETAHEARSRPATAASRRHPTPDWATSAMHSRSNSRPSTAIRRAIPSDTSSDRADSGVGGLPPRSQSAAATERKSSPSALQSSFLTGLGFAASAASPPSSPLDPATVAVNALSRPGGKPLGMKDKALLFGLVDALRTTCWQMQATAEEAPPDVSRLRRKLEAAKRALESLDAGADDHDADDESPDPGPPRDVIGT
nr:hypothetical protein CFP56_68338 [Quercus suber]